MNKANRLTTRKREIDRVVILGSNSFGGAVTVNKCLDAQMKVWGISRSQELEGVLRTYGSNSHYPLFNFKQLDLNKDLNQICDLVDTVKPDAIIDFAGQGMVAQSWENPDQWYNTNILAKSKLHKALLGNKHLKVYLRVSTPEVYGNSPKLMQENAPYRPSTPYAVSHAAIDMSLSAYFSQYGFPVITARFANFFGPGQQLYRIVPRTILAAMGNGSLVLDGGGTSVRSFIYGDDTADAILTSLKYGSLGEVYHFATEEFVSIRDLVTTIATKMNVDPRSFCTDGPDRPGKDLAYFISAEKAKMELGWRPNTSLADGINQTIEWFTSNIDGLTNLSRHYIHKI